MVPRSGGNTDTKGLTIVTTTEPTPSAPEDFLRVGGSSNPQKVASAIAHAIYEHKHVKVRAVGAGAVNQAVKAMAISRGYVAPRGIDLTFKVGFQTIQSYDGDVSAIVFFITGES